MFGRGLRLTALSSLASASLYTVHSTPVHSEPVVQRTTPAESVCSTSNDNTNFRPGDRQPDLQNLSTLKTVRNLLQQETETLESVEEIYQPESDESSNCYEDFPQNTSDLGPPGGSSPSYTGPSGPEKFDFSGTGAPFGTGGVGAPMRRDTTFTVYDTEVIGPNEQGRQHSQQEKLKAAINKARDLCWCKMYESGSPGMVVCISVNGKTVWQHGFGYADLENRLLVGTGCIMRIASISKSITMAVLARLVEEGKVDLDSSVSKYVGVWPEKMVDGEKVDITVRQLASHLGGIRHYNKKGEALEGLKEELTQKEYYLKKEFKTTEEALALFKDDELMSKPGSEFLYSSHGFTLLQAVIENVTGQPFSKYMKDQFKELGLNNTYLDENGPIITNRSKYYVRDKHHRLNNAPYVDNSYKWAGGGFLSTAQDLTRFGNAMLYSYQKKDKPLLPAQPPAGPPEPAAGPLQSPPGLPDKHKEDKDSPTPSLGIPKEESESCPHSTRKENTPPSKINPKTGDNPKPKLVNNTGGEKEGDNEINNTLQDIVFQPGVFSAINNNNKQKVRYLPGYLTSVTMSELWGPQPNTALGWGGDKLNYGLGWAVRPRKKEYAFCKNENFYASHTGGAIGASSVLLVAPHAVVTEDIPLPQGVVVAIMCNMQGVGLNKLAVDIAKAFEGISTEKPVKVRKVYQC